MKNFIHNLLQQSGFYPVENDNTTLFIGNDDNPRKSYWVILERDDLDFLEIQNKVFSDCRSLVKKPDFDKNCSLVILLKITEETDLVELKKTTLLIEENPYYFKKYVLIYKDEEYEHLIIKKEDKPERQFLENQITNRECFNTYKANPQTHNWQSLVFRMALKFPFMTVRYLYYC